MGDVQPFNDVGRSQIQGGLFVLGTGEVRGTAPTHDVWSITI
jgi:hypothetical protein